MPRPSCSAPQPPYPASALVVLTGGPGGGKTAVLEIVRQHFCEHVAVLPEAASVIFSGGFPRHATVPGRKAGQRAIYHVQRQLEQLFIEDQRHALLLCDRGTLDGLAYWPGDEANFFSELCTSEAAELARYAAVIHLRTPGDGNGYNHQNPVRTESAAEAATIDDRIAAVWARHPQRFEIGSTSDFLVKAGYAIALIEAQLAALARGHVLPRLPLP